LPPQSSGALDPWKQLQWSFNAGHADCLKRKASRSHSRNHGIGDGLFYSRTNSLMTFLV
jgi:hypothetical protein